MLKLKTIMATPCEWEDVKYYNPCNYCAWHIPGLTKYVIQNKRPHISWPFWTEIVSPIREVTTRVRWILLKRRDTKNIIELSSIFKRQEGFLLLMPSLCVLKTRWPLLSTSHVRDRLYDLEAILSSSLVLLRECKKHNNSREWAG
jgi:hypothetical protein